jgi:fibronectin-binding autotransporter adhesin
MLNRITTRTVFSLTAAMSMTLTASADTFEWTNSVSGDFGDATKWTNTTGVDFPPPNTGDIVEFNELGAYLVTLNGSHSIDDLRVFDGDVQLSSTTSTLRTLNIATGNADANISGGNLYVGTSSNPVFLNLPNVTTSGPDSVSVMNIGNGSSGGVYVSGADSRLDVLGATNHYLGRSGGIGTLHVTNDATANYGVNGILHIGNSGVATSEGHVTVESAGTLNTGHIDIATNASGATGSMTVDGGGSSISQTLSGATLDVGNASGGNGSLTIQNSGTFNSGTGQTTVLATGDIIHSGGTYNANGDIVLDGGNVYLQATTFNLAAGKNLSASSGSQVDMDGDYFLRNGSVFTIDSDADLSVTGFMDVGNGSDGTLIVDGPGSSFSKFGTSFWGDTGATGSVTVRNNATAALLGTTRIAAGNSLGTHGTLDIESGADVSTHNLSINHQGADGTGAITLTGIGSTLTQAGTSTLTIGHSTTGTGTFTLADSASFDSATGQTTVNATGTIDITGAIYNANGDIHVDGGSFNQLGGSFNMGANADLTIENNGSVVLTPFAGSFNLFNTNTIEVDGEGSSLEFSGYRMRIQGDSIMNVINGGDALIHTNFDIANVGDGTVLVSGAGSSLITEVSNQKMWWGRDTYAADVTFTDGATAAFPGGIEFNNNAASTSSFMVSDGASVSVGDLEIAAAGSSTFTHAILTVTGTDSVLSLDNTSTLTLGQHAQIAVGGRAEVIIENGGHLITGTGGINLYDSGDLTLDGGHLTLNGELNVLDNDPFFGRIYFDSGVIDFNPPAIDLVADSSGISIGQLDADTSFYFHSDRTVNLAGDIHIHAGGELPMRGGDLTADTLYLHTGGVLSFNTFISQSTYIGAKALAVAGSSIEVGDGDPVMGDASATNGFYSNGNISLAGGTTLTLHDANDAVLDSAAHVLIGEAGSASTLIASNGLTLDFGGNIEGFGTVNTPDDPFTPLINNGNLTGTSPSEPLTLTGYIKGVGTMDNVVITGTDAPGFSPASVYRGSVTYAGELEIEIGGLAPGSFDIINHLGSAKLGGVLDLSLINGFTPGLGDTFQFITASSIVGNFASISGSDLGGGLAFDVLYGSNGVTLQVINTPLQGDLNADGFVGIADLNIVLGVWNTNVTPGDLLAGDPSGDGFVGIADLNVVLGNWNAGTPPSEISDIPEPSTAILLGMGLGGLLRRSHRATS